MEGRFILSQIVNFTVIYYLSSFSFKHTRINKSVDYAVYCSVTLTIYNSHEWMSFREITFETIGGDVFVKLFTRTTLGVRVGIVGCSLFLGCHCEMIFFLLVKISTEWNTISDRLFEKKKNQ